MATKTNPAIDFLTKELDKAQGEIDAQKKARDEAIDQATRNYDANMADVLDEFERNFTALSALDSEATSKYDSPDVLRGKEKTKPARGNSNGGTRKARTSWTEDMSSRVVKFLETQSEPVKIKAIKDDLTEQFGAIPSNVGTKVGDLAEDGTIKKQGSLAQTTYEAA